MDDSRKKQLRKFIRLNRLPKLSLSSLNIALTHKSFANELSQNRYSCLDQHNQRLEFLGDAVLGAVIASSLYQKNPNDDEGGLTQKKSEIVCEAALFGIGSTLKIGEYLLMGKGELSSGGNSRVSNIADAVESLIAIIFIEKGYDVSRKFILELWKPYLQGELIPDGSIDYKSKLQEYLMGAQKLLPEYKILSTEGPKHQNLYHVALLINGKKILEGEGMSKKKAEQKVAKQYLKRVGKIPFRIS